MDLLSWDQEELKAIPAQQVYSLVDHGQGLYLRTNQIKQMCGLITYMKHLFGAYNSDIDPRDDPFHPFTPDEWSQQTSTMLRTYLIQHQPNPNGPEPVPSGPIPSSRPTGYSPAAIELMGFKKGVEKPLFSIGLISFCADQFSSCTLLQSGITYLHVSFTAYEYLSKRCIVLSMVTSSSDPEEPVIHDHTYVLIHLCPQR